jgi:hypothetical protein
LSTLDFEKDFTYQPGSPTAAVYQQAKALLDTALPLAADSPDVQTFVQVLQGRALLALGQYDQAAAAVASVPEGATYRLKIAFVAGTDRFAYWSSHRNAWSTVADGEGQNGLHYLTSGDPRTATTQLAVQTPGGYRTVNYPNKYNGYTSTQLRNDTVSYNFTDSVMFTPADWIEARLIQAEAELQAGDIQTWANTLNMLRANAGATLSPAIGPIPPLSSDSTTNASATLRVDVLFHERAFWLFLTGHRNGDLRRLIRNYGRDQSQVYPAGAYLGGQSSTGVYGTDVNAPIPANESINPLFHGCLNRDA